MLKKRLKKIIRKRSVPQKFLRRHGLKLLIFSIVSLICFAWMYAVPVYLDQNITATKINNFLTPKVGFKIDYTTAQYYTTPSLAVGVRFQNFKIVYPDSKYDDDDSLFLKSSVAIFEMPLFPLMLKTITFNVFSFNTVNVVLYQNERGEFVYIKHLKENFNPKMPSYLLEIPEIELIRYSLNNYNQRTGQLKRKTGNLLSIKPENTKEVLSKCNSRTIMLK